MSRGAVGLFAKPVVPGRVKTRLCPPLTPGEAAVLYRAFLVDLSRMLDGAAVDWKVFSTDTAGQRETWPAAAAPAPEILPQVGDDLGSRMLTALRHLTGDGERPAVLIGSDHPTLSPAHLEAAFAALERAEMVFGPSTDGGYVLVGARTPRRELFEGIAWSTPAVLAETLDRAEEHGVRCAFLDPWYDVDTAEDLAFLRLHLRALVRELGDAAPCPATRRALAGLPTRSG
jgi:rSAM/selenodomain-associated transferase 1